VGIRKGGFFCSQHRRIRPDNLARKVLRIVQATGGEKTRAKKDNEMKEKCRRRGGELLRIRPDSFSLERMSTEGTLLPWRTRGQGA